MAGGFLSKLFGGDKAKYEKQLKEQGLTEKQVRNDIRAQLVSEKIFAKVTREVKVTDAQIADYYAKNKAQYSQPPGFPLLPLRHKSLRQTLLIVQQSQRCHRKQQHGHQCLDQAKARLLTAHRHRSVLATTDSNRSIRRVARPGGCHLF